MQVILNNVSNEIYAVLESLKALSPNLEIEPCIYTKEEIKRELDESVAQIESGNFVGCTQEEIKAELGL